MIECKLCHKFYGSLGMHLKYIHYIDGKQYKVLFPGAIASKSWSEGLTKETDARVNNMSLSLKKVTWSEERNNKIRLSHTGRKRNESWKSSIRNGLLKYYKENPDAGYVKNKLMYVPLNKKFGKTKMNKPESILFDIVKRLCWITPKYNYHVKIYYIDVALPEIRIGFECDGEQWRKEKFRDIKRDFVLYNEGWKIYRFPSQLLCKNFVEVEEQIRHILSGYNNESE